MGSTFTPLGVCDVRRCTRLQLLSSLQALHATPHMPPDRSHSRGTPAHQALLRHRRCTVMQTYPSSRKQVVDWNKLEHDLKEEEKTEVLDGEAGAQKLFRTIYAGTPRLPPLNHRCLGHLMKNPVTLVLGGVWAVAAPWSSEPSGKLRRSLVSAAHRDMCDECMQVRMRRRAAR